VKLSSVLIPRARTAALAALTCATLATTIASSAVAQQVGYSIEKTPYRDLVWSQHLTVYGGYYRAGRDAVRAAPGSGPLLGLRYELDIAGPAQFFVRAARVSSERESYNPALPALTRQQGTVSAPLWLADAGFSFNLTGRKSWHSIVPVAGFALGVVSSTKKATNDPYSLGTQFSFSTQLGIRVVPSDRYEFRFMLDNIFYQNHYPSAYFVRSSDTTAVLSTNTSKSSYLPNLSLTAGLSIPIFR
jgi:hypothetical protein